MERNVNFDCFAGVIRPGSGDFDHGDLGGGNGDHGRDPLLRFEEAGQHLKRPHNGYTHSTHGRGGATNTSRPNTCARTPGHIAHNHVNVAVWNGQSRAEGSKRLQHGPCRNTTEWEQCSTRTPTRTHPGGRRFTHRAPRVT